VPALRGASEPHRRRPWRLRRPHEPEIADRHRRSAISEYRNGTGFVHSESDPITEEQ
jgi:hypothetical protein